MNEFEQYYDANPRAKIPKSLKGFLKYAQGVYEHLDAVNWTYPEEDEMSEEVENYISESSEALLLFIQYLKDEQGILFK